MRVIVTNSYEKMSATAARMVAGQLYLKPDSVLGLATGSTPLLMYQNLIRVGLVMLTAGKPFFSSPVI